MSKSELCKTALGIHTLKGELNQWMYLVTDVLKRRKFVTNSPATGYFP